VDAKFLEFLGFKEAQEWGDSTAWQYWVIDTVKHYERERGYVSHPIGMTMQFPVPDQTKVNDPLFASAAEWISPGYDDEIFKDGGHPMAPGSPPSRWFDDPPAATGAKVVITDTDHYAPGKGDALWAWKSFVRGHHPILMDFGIVDVVNPLDASTGVPPTEFYEPARNAMGDTRRFADRLSLGSVVPRDDLASTRFVLAEPGKEYLVLQPNDSADAFTVSLAAGTYAVEWFSVNTRQTVKADAVTVVRDGSTSFTAPFGESDPCVLYLKRAGA
jgi:hypothetical protein